MDAQRAEIRRLHAVLRERDREINELRTFIEQEARHFESNWGPYMGMSGNYVAAHLRKAGA